MTLEEALAKLATLEKELAQSRADLAAEKAKATPANPAPPRLGVTARQVEALEETIKELRADIAKLKPAEAPKPPAPPADPNAPKKKSSCLKDR